MLVRPPESDINGRWLAYFYRHDMGQRQILARAVGSTMVNLNSTLLRKLLIAKPERDEQVQIVQRLMSLDARIHQDWLNVCKLRLLKTGLMQDLLTGRVRVRVDGGKSKI